MKYPLKKCASLIDSYGYKYEWVSFNFGRGYVQLFDNFLKSPYPRIITSVHCTYDGFRQVFTREGIIKE